MEILSERYFALADHVSKNPHVLSGIHSQELKGVISDKVITAFIISSCSTAKSLRMKIIH
jgi:hypothetical protein